MTTRLPLPGFPGRGGPGTPPPPRIDDAHELVDTYGRVARDLRVSLTDRCNLRCTYCMPAEGLEWLPTEASLTDEEVIRLITIAVTRLGIRQVRFTGGEPLLRKSLEKIIAATTALRTDEGLPVATALTTNGLGLPRRLPGLKEAGLERVNISLDTVDQDRYTRLTRRDRLADVLAAIDAALAADMHPVKVNSVIMPGVNEQDIVPLAEYCLARGAQLRFIEQMPLGPREEWRRGDMVTADQILGELRTGFMLTPAEEPRGAAPAALWEARGVGKPELRGSIGVIASVTRPFCGDCDRTRLTTDGAIRTCLFSRTETSLRELIRGGAGDAEIAAVWAGAMWGKLPGHGIDDPGFLQPDRPMSAIGG
jgi:GTP 3',8-cyclase